MDMMASGTLFLLSHCLSVLTLAGDYVTHVMARMQPRTLREGWKRVIQEDSSKVYDELEKSNPYVSSNVK
jgi:hypothetical protein